ncbi:hypothetical protein C823_004903 [Eubacterium plexicaudatum ASF492]|jgi:GntR family transcriptional regulator|uniref:GntR family transcriptional regulator n=2 Tax=Bacillota TaxID=1239 RepID=A0A4R3YQ80_9FIRM|nr:GntR family transcriptional regulator [Phocaeicola sartorii]KAI4450370.1 hypothetical protein C823_004903 [Eubacterium plexicaudatum ASF492]TCV94482.1 GntR family transcriptional regulator [Longibaculum muris]
MALAIQRLMCYTVIHKTITVETGGGEEGLKLIISNVSGVPIYEQIKRQVKAAILSGELKEEEALPSLRTLAKDLKISVLTVTRAYTELEQEGFVKNVQGRGCFVLGSGSELMKEQLICKVENGLTEAIKAAKIANLSNEELHHLLDILLEANTDD